jgi:outer membrane biosynthesis protein TonB
MLPQSQPKKTQNSSKVNLTISAVVHGVIILGLIYFAAREGYLGKKIREITVYKVEKEKPPEKPVEKPKEVPPKEVPKPVELPKVVEAPKPQAPPSAAPPVVAPPVTEVASFDFEGGKAVNSESDPVQLYKGYLEYTLRTKWNRPENLADEQYVAEVGVAVDAQGNLRQEHWLKGSGDAKWDQSVKDVFKVVSQIDRRPPTNFPSTVTIRFDVEEETEPVMTQ